MSVRVRCRSPEAMSIPVMSMERGVFMSPRSSMGWTMEVGQRDLEQVEDETHDDGVDGRAVQQALGDLFGVGAAADHAVAHRPEAGD